MPVAVAVLVWVAPAVRAGNVAVQVMVSVSLPAGPSRGMTCGVLVAEPGQVIVVRSLSVTATLARCAVPVLVTAKVTATGCPGVTDTPGVVLASLPLSDFTMVTPVVAGAR